jgi:ankyrin repeat protein
MLRLILQRGVDVDAKDGNGMTALHIAAKSGDRAAITMLRQHHASVDTGDDYGRRAAHFAALGGHAALMREMHQSTTQAAGPAEKIALVHSAAASGDPPTIAAALELTQLGAQALDHHYYSAVHYAMLAPKTDGLRYLAQMPGTKLGGQSEHGETPLHVLLSPQAAVASEESRLQNLRAYLALNRAPLWQRNVYGWSPMHYAAMLPDARCLELLLDNRRIANEAKRISDLSHAAALANAASCLRLLSRLQPAANINFSIPGPRYPIYGTPLQIAAIHGSHDVLRALVSSRYIDLNAQRNYDGCTALHLANHSTDATAAKILLAVPGIDPNIRDAEGYTPILRTLTIRMPGSHDILREFLAASNGEMPVDYYAATPLGHTALHLATLMHDATAAQLLVNALPKLRLIADAQGLLPLDIAHQAPAGAMRDYFVQLLAQPPG